VETRKKKLRLNSGIYIKYKNYANLDLTGSDLSKSDLSSTDFSNTILARVNMKDVITDQFTIFDNADFTDVIVDHDFIETVDCNGTDLSEEQINQINRSLMKAEDKLYYQVHYQLCNTFLLIEEFFDNYSLINNLLAGTEDIFIIIMELSFKSIQENYMEYQLLLQIEKNIQSVDQIIKNDNFCKKYFPTDSSPINRIKKILDNKNMSRKTKWDQIIWYASWENDWMKIPPPLFFSKTPGPKDIFIQYILNNNPENFLEIYREELGRKEKKSYCVIL